MSAVRIFGITLAVLDIGAAALPNWFGLLTGPEVPGDVFEAIERRVRGGMVLGLGLCFIGITALRP